MREKEEIKMTSGRVYLPPNSNTADYDFLGFSFNDLFSQNEKFTIYRTSDGDRYNSDITPQFQDKTAEVPNGDGIYFFGTNYKSKTFNINFAFDNLDEEGLKWLRTWLNNKEICDLWFAEEPYKVYSAKVNGTPNLKYVVFEEDYIEYTPLATWKKKRIYKGEGSV
jgi:predicted phage tail component-like protein